MTGNHQEHNARLLKGGCGNQERIGGWLLWQNRYGNLQILPACSLWPKKSQPGAETGQDLLLSLIYELAGEGVTNLFCNTSHSASITC